MKRKTAELTGALLDAAVALAEGWLTRGTGLPATDPAEWVAPSGMKGVEAPPSFSTEWASGGPIIERERISLLPPECDDQERWTAGIGVHNICDSWEARHEATGPTALIAAMRAFVGSKLGEEVEIP